MRRTGLAIAAALAGTPGLAQDAGRASDRALAPLVSCRQTPDPRARAACYDAALDQLQQSVANRQVVIVDHDQAVQDRRTLFGFGAREQPVPKPARPPKNAVAARAAPEEVVEIDSTIVAATQTNYDQWVFRLATGAVWRTTEGSAIPVAPRAGTKVHIHRSIMGGYLMRVGSYRAVRALRIG